MSTFVSTYAKSHRAYLPTTALSKSVDCDADMLHVSLIDGRRISVPSHGFPCCLKPRQNSELNTKLVAVKSRCTGPNWMRICR